MHKERQQIDIRKARRPDAKAVAELSGQLGYPATEAEVAERLVALRRRSREHAVFIAEGQDRAVIGWLHCSVTPLLEVPLRAEVNGLVVAEGHRSAGAGAMLLEAAENWARNMGCKSMSVRSNVVRGRAHDFYLRNGYEHYKTQKAFRKGL